MITTLNVFMAAIIPRHQVKKGCSEGLREGEKIKFLPVKDSRPPKISL